MITNVLVRYIIQSAVGRHPPLLVELGAQSRYSRHEMENEITQWYRDKMQYDQEREENSFTIKAQEYEALVNEIKEKQNIINVLKGIEVQVVDYDSGIDSPDVLPEVKEVSNDDHMHVQ